MSQHGTLDMDAICMVLEEEKPNQREQAKQMAEEVVLSDIVRRYH